MLLDTVLPTASFDRLGVPRLSSPQPLEPPDADPPSSPIPIRAATQANDNSCRWMRTAACGGYVDQDRRKTINFEVMVCTTSSCWFNVRVSA